MLILCGGTKGRRLAGEEIIELDVSRDAAGHKRVRVDVDSLAERLVDNLPEVLNDLVEIASYVYSADRLVRRGGDALPRMGADWRRHLRFRIPVRRLDVWTRPEVTRALVETLCFLSDDEFTFEFEDGAVRAPFQPFFGFGDPGAQVFSPDDVILFSGGLDSLAGVVSQVLGARRKALLVTHQSSTTIAGRQNALADELSRRAPGQLFYARVWVRKGNQNPVEFTQRTRSFLFAALGISYARMFGRNVLHFFENGITSFNLPVAEHVVGSRASRTTHPHTLASFGRLFSAVLDDEVAVEDPFLWETKSQVVARLAQHGAADLVRRTTSCANVRDLSMTTVQCGVCSQCVERRFAVMGAGLDEFDPAEDYARDLFTGAHADGRDLTMIERHVVRAQDLATMSEHAFMAGHGQVFRALADLPGTQDENARRAFDLHRRYGAGVVEVIDRELRRNAGLVQALSLPETSLLCMVNSPAGLTSYRDPVEVEPTASMQAAAETKPIAQRRFALAIDPKTRRVLFADGAELSGVSYELFTRLAQQFRIDLERGAPPEAYGYVATQTLVADLKIPEEDVLRQRVRRDRRSLEEQFAASIDYSLDEQDVIQSQSWRGYRLNPYLLLVDIAQLEIA